MDELLTEQLITERCDFSSVSNYLANIGKDVGGILSKSQSPSTITNRSASLLKQLSSKLLLQTSNKSFANNENVNSNTTKINSTQQSNLTIGSANKTSNNNQTPLNNGCSSITVSVNWNNNSSDNLKTGSSSSLNSSNSSTNSLINSSTNDSTACSSSSSPSSSSANLINPNNNQTNHSLLTEQSNCKQANQQTKCDQVDCKSLIKTNCNQINSKQSNCSQNNCSINSNESQSSTIISTDQSLANCLTTSCQSNNQNLINNNQPNLTLTKMTNCNKCTVKFSVFRRKNLCNKCNKPFCFNCLANQKIKIKDKICSDCCTLIEQQSKQVNKLEIVEQTKCNKTMDLLNSLVSSQIINKEILDQSMNSNEKSTVSDRLATNSAIKNSNEAKEDIIVNHINEQQQTKQLITQSQLDLDNQSTNQLNTINDQTNLNLNSSNNFSINSNICANLNLSDQVSSTCDISNNSIIDSSVNLNSTTTSSSTKNDFVIISVLKKQGVTKTKNQNDTTNAKKVTRVCFEDGVRPGDENIIEQNRTFIPNLITVNSLNANLIANLTATSQIPSSRISFKPFLAHSQLTYAQKGLLTNTSSSSNSQRSKSSKRHLSSSQRQLTQQKLIQLSATSATLRNTAATYTVLTKTGTKLNQTSNKHLINNSNHSNRKLVYLTNGKLMVNSYSNYNDFYISKPNDMFQNEKLFTSYVLLA